MKCLAVNTATSALSIALTDGAEVLGVFESGQTRDQGNLLLKNMLAMLERNSLSFHDIDLLAAVTGPGSFTGIRIGLSAVRGIALAAGKPVVGVNSFDMFAVPGIANVVAVESWREELYFRMTDTRGEEIIPPVNETAQEFARRPQAGMSLVVSGDAAEKIASLLPAATVHGLSPNAVQVALIAASKYKEGKTAVKPVPFYLRDADITKPACA